jgi:hypothetical protein
MPSGFNAAFFATSTKQTLYGVFLPTTAGKFFSKQPASHCHSSQVACLKTALMALGVRSKLPS